MASAKIGLVLRTVRPTTAERAVREVMEEFFVTEGIDYESVDPENLDPARYRRLVFSPAEPIDPGCLAPGPHVLNAAAILESAPPGPLPDYHYVSVRSSADLARLGAIPAKAAVVPCVTTLLAERALPSSRRDAVGIHFDPVSFNAAPGWHEALREIAGLEKIFIPFDPDSGDRGVIARLIGAVGEGRSVGPRTPAELFEIIGGLRLFVCSSLHAALFAYLQNVPFLLFPKGVHETEYLRDRGLEPWIFRSPDELRRKATLLLAAAPDYRDLVEQDRALTRRHLDLLREALKGAGTVAVPDDLTTPSSRQPSYRFSGPLSHPASSPDSHMNENLRGFLSRLETELNRLHREIASQRDRIEELASEVDRLQGEVLRREDLLDEMRRSRAWRLASRLQDLAVYLRRGLGRLRGDAAR